MIGNSGAGILSGHASETAFFMTYSGNRLFAEFYLLFQHTWQKG